MNVVLMIAAGGAIGAVARHFVSGLVAAPWGIMFVNILGSFLMGILIEMLALKGSVSMEVRAFLATGVLGAFTTFSTFSLDAVSLFEKGAVMQMTVYVLGSVLLSLLALFAGLYLIRSLIA